MAAGGGVLHNVGRASAGRRLCTFQQDRRPKRRERPVTGVWLVYLHRAPESVSSAAHRHALYILHIYTTGVVAANAI
jgi:hypothetical protein